MNRYRNLCNTCVDLAIKESVSVNNSVKNLVESNWEELVVLV